MQQGSVHSSEDTLLLFQVSDGSRQAFDILYDKYFKEVYNSAYRRLKNAHHAADIAQEVFVQLWTRGSSAPIENLPAYLFTLVRNNIFKFLEKESKYAELPDFANYTEDPLNRADAFLLYQEFVDSFEQLIESLSPQQRLIFKMRFEEDLSSAEIAERLQISPKTVRNQLGKAIAKLKDALTLILLIYLLNAHR